jgi:fibronectin-binding autotransporter adhesin
MKPTHRLAFYFGPFALVSLSLFYSSSLMAADLYWDGPTSGSWNEVANWSTVPGEATPDPLMKPTTGDVVYFSVTGQTGGRTVNLLTNQSVNGIVSTGLTGTVTFRGGDGAPVNLTLGDGGIDHTRGGLTFGNPTDPDKVNVILGASQSWISSATEGGASALMLHNDVSATGDHILTLDGINLGSHISGAIFDGAGKVSIVKQGTGTWELRGTNTYSGTTKIEDGILRVGTAASLSPSTTVDVADGATFSIKIGGTALTSQEADAMRGLINFESSAAFLGLDPAGAFEYTSDLGGNHGLMKTGGSTLTLSGNNTYTGDTVIADGLIAYKDVQAISDISKIEAKAGAGVYAFAAVGGSADGFTEAQLEELRAAIQYEDKTAFFGISTDLGSLNYDVAMEGEHSFVKAGPNTLTFGGAGSNIYTGTTRVAGGTLSLAKTGGATAITGDVLMTGGTLSLAEANQIADASVITGTGGTVNFLAKNETVAGVALSGGAQLQTGNTGGNNPTSVVNLGAVTATNESRITVNSGGKIIASSLSLTGTIESNNSSGNILMGGGHNTAVSELEIGAGGLTMQNRTIQVNSATVSQKGTRITLNGTFTGSGENLIKLSAPTFTLAELFMGTGERTFNITGGNSRIDLSVAGEILRKTGNGTLTLAGANVYTGVTKVDGGFLKIRHANALGTTGSGTEIGNSGRLQLQGGITVTGETLNVTHTGDSMFLESLFLESEDGAGKNTNTWAGTINLNTTSNSRIVASTGRLLITGNIATSGSGSGQLVLQGVSGGEISGVISGNRPLVRSSVDTSTWILSGANTYTGGTTISNGTIQLGNGGATGSLATGSAINIGAATANFAVNRSNKAEQGVDFSNTISGPGSFIQAGTGATILKTANYTGSTNINAGTLQFARTTALYNNNPANWTAAKITVASGATLALNVGGANEFTSGNVDTVKALGTATGGFLNNSRLGLDTTNAAGGKFTYASAIGNTNSGANSIGLTKLGTGTLELTASNTYTGTTHIQAGALNVADGGALNGGGSVIVDGGATFNLLGTYLFNIGDNGAGNQITGAGNADLTGVFSLNLASAAIADGNQWSLVGITGSVDWDGLQVTSTSGDFTRTGEIWTRVDGSNTWTFDQTSGVLALAVPEPGQVALLLIGSAGSLLRRRRK